MNDFYKRHEFWFVFLIAVFLFVFSLSKVFAVTLYEINIPLGYYTALNETQNSNQRFGWVMAPTTSGTLGNIYFWSNAVPGGGSSNCQQATSSLTGSYFGVYGSFNSTSTAYDASTNFLASTTPTNLVWTGVSTTDSYSGNTWCKINFTIDATTTAAIGQLNSGQFYWAKFYNMSSNSAVPWAYPVNSNVDTRACLSGGTCYDTIDIPGLFSGNPLPQNSITITYPPNGTTTSAYFNNWITAVQYEHLTTATTSDYYFAWVRTDTSSSNLETSISGTSAGSILTDCDLYDCDQNLNQTLLIPNTLGALSSSTPYYARAWLIYSTLGNRLGEIVASSSLISFNTNNLTLDETIYNPIYGYTYSTSTPGQCTDEWSVINAKNCLVNGFTEVLQWLFQPPQWSLNFISNSYQQFKNVFPFNIFFDFNRNSQNVLQLSEYSTNPQLNFYLATPTSTGNVATTSLIVFSSSTLNSVIGTTATNTIFDLQKWSAWIIVSFLAYRKIKKAFK